MEKGTLTRKQRTNLLSRLRELDAMLYPADDATPAPRGARRARMNKEYFRVLAEYFERLPRVVMSVCPFTREPLKRAFDPFGLDGPWWQKELLCEINEPAAPAAFKVLLGALRLRAGNPEESQGEMTPGPEVPYVVPRLLELPGMVAVVSELRVQTGDVAYPVAYFSKEDIPPAKLHQPWLREQLWFKTENGDASWLIANDSWDFDLKAWVDRKKLWWVVERGGKQCAVSSDSGESCPFLNLPGERRPQIIIDGSRSLGDLPSGAPLNPFAE